MTAFAELGARSNFTLLDGASHPAELVATAAGFGHAGIGICDRNSLAGAVRAHVAAKDAQLPFVVGARLVLDDDAGYLAWPTDRASYGRLTKLLSLGRMRAPKGQCQISRAELLDHAEGWVLAAMCKSPSHNSRRRIGLHGVLLWPRNRFFDRERLCRCGRNQTASPRPVAPV
jgi:error-prone DNA polymerase